MPRFTVTHPTTGKSVTITGPSMPSEQELDSIFAQTGGSSRKVYGKPDASPAETERMRREFVEREGTAGTRVKEGAKTAVKAAMPYVRPVLEGGGAAVGGIVGAGSGFLAGAGLGAIPGTVAGGSLGYAGGKSLADVLEQVPTSAGQTLKDLGTGAMYEMGGGVAGVALSGAAKQVPRIAAAVRSPIQTRAASKARQVLEATAGLTEQEAANAAKAQALESKLGAKLSPAQRTGKPSTSALEQGLATADPEFSAALTAQDTAAKDAALGKIRQAVGKGKSLPQAADTAETGDSIAQSLKAARDKGKVKHQKLYADIPDVPLPTEKVAAAVNELKSGFKPGDETVYPKTAISRIEAAIKPHGHGEVTPEMGEYLGSMTNNVYVQKPSTVKFQELHSLRKDIGRQINDATKGAQPNYELAAKLRKLKGAIDETIDLNMGANDKYKEAKKAFVEYADKFRTGAVNKSLQRGFESSGLKLADEQIPKQFFTPSGAAGLVKSIGSGAAKEKMRPYVVTDLLKTAAPNGADFNVSAGLRYMQKNRAVLGRLGLADEVQQVVKDQLPAELERMLAKRAPDAVTGKQFFTGNDMRGILQKYGATIKQLYGPEALQSFRDYNSLVNMIDRKNVVPRGGNSNTAEKAMNVANLMLKEATGPAKRLTDGLLGAMAQGAGIGTGATFAAGHMSGKGAVAGAAVMGVRQLAKNAESQVAKTFAKILQDATLNPEVARDLMRVQKTGKVPPSLQAIIDNNLIGPAAIAVSGKEEEE